jgi:hypothetical protein
LSQVGQCFGAVPDPCANGGTTYLQTRGYRRVAFDSCVPAANDTYAPIARPCGGTTQSTSSGATTATTAATTASSTLGTATTASTAPATTGPAPSHMFAYVVAGLLVVVLAGLVIAFLVLRRNPAFVRRFGGRLPFVPKPADPYSTLGELETGASNFDEDF